MAGSRAPLGTGPGVEVERSLPYSVGYLGAKQSQGNLQHLKIMFWFRHHWHGCSASWRGTGGLQMATLVHATQGFPLQFSPWHCWRCFPPLWPGSRQLLGSVAQEGGGGNLAKLHPMESSFIGNPEMQGMGIACFRYLWVFCQLIWWGLSACGLPINATQHQNQHGEYSAKRNGGVKFPFIHHCFWPSMSQSTTCKQIWIFKFEFESWISVQDLSHGTLVSLEILSRVA